MALRLGVKISSVAGQSVTPIRFRRQFQSLSPVASFKISPNQRAASGIVPANKKSSKQSITKNADKNQKYSTKDRVTRDFNEYNAVEQYELEAAKPREKMHRVNRVYEFMSKLQQNQNWRILPHLQPSNLRPYGSTDNIIFPESLRQRDLIKYPQEDEVLAEVEEEMSEKSVQQYSKDEFTNRRDYSTFEKKHNHKNDCRKMATKSKHIEEENVSLGASEVNKESLNKFDSVSEETKSEKNKIWPSYSDILRHEINKDVMTTSTRKLHQSCNPLGPSAQRPVPLSEMNVGLNLNEAIKEPKIKSTILTDPINEVEIREPELKPMAMKLKKGKKPKESWDQYCPEEEEIIIKRECPIIPRKLPKLIPRDCPCVEPPPPCDVPPLPRLDLEVCEPRPECPIHPCETTPRADIDCWEYMESPEVDCRVIPVKRKGECNKCEMKRRKDKNRSSCPYSTSAFKGDMQSKRQYSSLTAVSTDYENVTKIVPDFIIPIPSVQRHVDENTQINNDILFDNFATFGRNLNNSTSTPVLLNKLGSIQADMISRQYSTNDERCIKKPKKDCKLPPADNCNACKHGKEKKCTRECPTFCMHDCPPANPRGTECIPRHEVCCEKAQTPYPSYSECLVSYLAPFTNFPNYKCIKCPKRDNPGFYYKKFSTMAAHHNGANSSLFSSHCKSVKGKRVFSTHVRKPLLSTPAKFRKSGIRNKHKKKNPCKLCVDISYPNCPPRCRFTCDKDPIDDNCTKRNSPYPSFSECVIEELDEYISECPYNLEATHRLQPKYEMLSKMAYLIKHLPAPGFKPFDPLKEEKCIRSKLCIKNDGVSQCCNDFGKPHAALKNKDFFEPNDRTQCKFLTNKQEKQDSRKIKRKYHTKTLNTDEQQNFP
ncbi:unnamed protein product [Brassicogethes aeneus]|uniref:Uncharacterized protein n=1 Tax=Brassicogethes aeneus TaxID=1431903 RepID=A0A9P0ARS0_BRAAE|nr:unnamed protein product [Brassicogethes aeneus]